MAKKERPRKTSLNVAKTKEGTRYYLSGRETVNGKSARVYVGTFTTEKQVEKARIKFIATGWKAKPKKRGPKAPKKAKKAPAIHNLRDQEVDMLKRFRPELMGGDPRARRQDETVAEWAKRLAVMKGFIAA